MLGSFLPTLAAQGAWGSGAEAAPDSRWNSSPPLSVGLRGYPTTSTLSEIDLKTSLPEDFGKLERRNDGQGVEPWVGGQPCVGD